MNTLIFRMAWRNIWRNSRRTVITLITMVICVGTMVWMITLGDGMHAQMIRSALNLGLGSIQIHVDGYHETKDLEKAIMDPRKIIDEVKDTPGMEGVSVRLNAQGLASHGNNSQGAMIIGVDPAGEKKISIVHEKIIRGEWLPSEIESERMWPIVIGAGMAKKLGVDLGDRVFMTIQGFARAPGYGNYSVVGIFNTGMTEMDKNVGYVPIETLYTVMADDLPKYKGSAHEVTLLLREGYDEFETTKEIRQELENKGFEGYEVMSWQQIQPGMKKFIDLDALSIYILMIFVFVIVAAGIMNTFLMSVFERIREFGILMSLGSRPLMIFKLVMTESALVGLLGALLGLGAGLIGYWINLENPWSMEAYGEINEIMSMDWSMKLVPMLIWVNVMKAVGGIFVMTLLAALWPAIKASILRPVEALRHV